MCQDYLVSIGVESDELDAKLKELAQLIHSEIKSNGFPMVRGVKKLIQNLSEHNIPMAIATNGLQRESSLMTLVHDFDINWFSHIIYGGDDHEVKNNKPAPDIYLVCSQRFKSPPKSLESCVIFEDSVRGITGAVASGMKTVLVNSSTDLNLGSIGDKITLIVDSFDNFKPESVGLPPYE